MRQILCIEDSAEEQLVIKKVLSDGYITNFVSSLAGARKSLAGQKFDLILLDVSLPDGDGFQFCSELQNDPSTNGIPIFLITGKSSIHDKTLGFTVGADDYLVKPYAPAELKLRIDAKLKKLNERKTSLENLKIGDLLISILEQRAYILSPTGKQPIDLSPMEFKLLNHLAHRPGQVFSREQLIDAACGSHIHISDRSIDSHISRLRKKIKSSGVCIEAIHGSGYTLGNMPAINCRQTSTE